MASRARGRVIVVGSSNTDLVVHCNKLPGAGETVLGGDMLTFAGGKGANQAVAAARAGAKVYFIGAFGDDAFGQARRADLEREGIDCSGCVIKKGVPSGVALIAIGKSAKGHKAENLIVVAPGANARLTPADVKRGMPKNLASADVVIASMEVPLQAIHTSLEHGASKACTTILNPAPFPSNGFSKGDLRRFMNSCVLLTPNSTEFEQMTRINPTTTAVGKKVASWFSRNAAEETTSLTIALTLGAIGAMALELTFSFEILEVELKGKDGVRLLREEETGLKSHLNQVLPKEFGTKFGDVLANIIHVKAPKVNAVDTVGAGDCFNGALSAHLAQDRNSIKKALRFAVTAASLKVTRHGAQAGMPYRHEILKMMKKLPRA